jgi:hypothetical protein
METGSPTTPRTALTASTSTNSETETHRNFRLTFGKMQKYPKLKLRKKILGAFT